MAREGKSRSQRLSAGPVYLALLCALIIAILMVNGYFEISRTRASLRGILENQGETLLRGLEREIQNTVSVTETIEQVPGTEIFNIAASTTFFTLEDALVNYLLEIATTVDQKAANQRVSASTLEDLARREGVKRIDIVEDPSQSDLDSRILSAFEPLFRGTRHMVIVPFEKLVPEDKDLFSIAIRGERSQGIVAVSIDASQARRLRRKFVIQNVLESIGFGEGIQYLSIFDSSLSLIAEINREGPEEVRDKAFVAAVGGGVGKKSAFRTAPSGQEVFEIVRTLQIDGKPYGVMQLGLSTGPIQKILSLSKRSILLSVAVLLGLSITGVTLIYVNQNRHLARLREMEERTRAAERLISIGKLGAGLAHEIRNPLNAIAMAIQRLHREFPPRQAERAEEYGEFIGVIREEIKRLNQIVDQFVLFSKPSKLTLTPVLLADVLEDIAVLFAEEARARGIAIRKEFDQHLPAVVIDKAKIAQALVNIVTNAFHAMEEGGTLAIKGTLERKEWARITVSDTGRGIPKGEIEKIFDYSYTTREKGLGLGLPIAHKIVEEHGGMITVESEMGRGTSVSVLLPIGGP